MVGRLIHRRADGALLGAINLTEALQLMLRTAFRTHRVEHAGFRRQGHSRRYLKIARRWRDHERWALLAAEWRSPRRSGHSS